MPWLNCREFSCAARHSMPPLAGHSMKWIRDTDGNRTMSFIVKNQRALDQAVDHQPVLFRIDVRPARMVALEKQPVRRDDAVQILQRRKTDGRFGAGGEPWHVAPDDAGLGVRRPAIGPVNHAGSDRLRPRRIGRRASLCRFRVAGPRAERKAAGQRRAQAEKRTPGEPRIGSNCRLRCCRPAASQGYRGWPHVSSPRGSLRPLLWQLSQGLSSTSNLVNAKLWRAR